jgi:hypothetical protein
MLLSRIRINLTRRRSRIKIMQLRNNADLQAIGGHHGGIITGNGTVYISVSNNCC